MPYINGQFVDKTKLNQPNQTSNSASAGETDQFAPIRTFLIMKALSDLKNAPKYSTALGMLPQKSEAQQKEERTANKLRTKVDSFVSTLEDKYFKNKLYKGDTWRNRIENMQVKMGFKTNDPYAIYMKELKSQGAALAKLAGDSGNIAVQEQLNQLQAFPSILNNRKTAEEMFTDLRTRLDLPQRDYKTLDNYQTSGIEDLMKSYMGK